MRLLLVSALRLNGEFGGHGCGWVVSNSWSSSIELRVYLIFRFSDVWELI
jgi:hypothetical protein